VCFEFICSFVGNIQVSNKNRARYEHTFTYICLHVKYLSFLSDFSKTNISLTIFLNIKMLNFMEILLVEGEVFHADGRTEGRRDRHDKANRLFVILQKRMIKFYIFSCANAIHHEKKYVSSYAMQKS